MPVREGEEVRDATDTRDVRDNQGCQIGKNMYPVCLSHFSRVVNNEILYKVGYRVS